MGTPKVPNMLLEHIFGGANAFPGPVIDFQQVGGTKNQNSPHTSDFERHEGPISAEVLVGSNFEYVDTPKVSHMLLEHANELPKASPGPLSDFFQRGCPQHRKSHHTSICEGHNMKNRYITFGS